MADAIFAVTLLTKAANLTMTSGGTTQVFAAPAGAAAFSIPMVVGQQSFALARSGVNVLAANSLKDVSDVCPCGCVLNPFYPTHLSFNSANTQLRCRLYNFNAYTGSVPENIIDPLGADGLASLVTGLHVTTCSPSASLPTSASPYTGAGGTATAQAAVSTITSAPAS